MATKPPANDPQNDAFLREVDDAYREDEFKKFIARYGRWILLAIGLGLAALGGTLAWNARAISNAESRSEAFSTALSKLDSGSAADARPAFAALATSDHAGYRALGKVTEAGIAVNAADTPRAVTLLRAVIDDPKAPQPLRDAATMKLLRLQFDSLPPAEVLKRTAPYLAGDSPWFPVAGELAGIAYIKAGQPEKAGPLFFRLASDARVSQSVRARAEQMAAALGQDVTKIVDARAAAEAAQAAAPKAPQAAAAG